MRKIAVVTGTRAEFGLLYNIMKGIHEDRDLELQLIVTGTHLSPEYGMTVTDIESSGLPIAERIDMELASDDDEGIARSMGIGFMGFSRSYARLKPDLLVLLGDRFEIHTAASAAVPFRIPVAHVHGGELTEGAMDELFRHSITKLSHLHFAATKTYAQRIQQMGEQPDRVFVTGAPGLDHLHTLRLLERKELARELGISDDRNWGVVTLHPTTLEDENTDEQVRAVLGALDGFSDMYWLFTYPNADRESTTIINRINAYVHAHSHRASVHISLGQQRYLSLLKTVLVMVGNSSSGIIEAPSFALPVVNIGNRQGGRLRAKNVIDVIDYNSDSIKRAIEKSLSRDFRQSLTHLNNPYGDGKASARIIDILKTRPLRNLVKKPFYDMT